MYKDKQILGCISDSKYAAYDNTGTGLSATNAQDAITELNGNLPKQCTTMEVIHSINTKPTTPLDISFDSSQYKKVGIRMSCGYSADYIVDLETIKAQGTHYFTHALIYNNNYYWSVFGNFTENSISLSEVITNGWNFAGIAVIGLK